MYYLDAEVDFESNRAKLIYCRHNTVIVCRGGPENVIGLVIAKDLLARMLDGERPDFAASTQPPLFVPEVISAMQLLDTVRKERCYLAFVVDEYGEVMGLVTLTDVLGALVGDLPWIGVDPEPDAVQREDGSWLLDGQLGPERFAEIFGVELERGAEEREFHTLAGFVLQQMGRVPRAADHFEWHGLRFEVVDMDRNRIDKVLVGRLPAA
jgi:putative hemolysin